MKKLAGILLCLLMVFECTSMSNVIVFAQSIETTEEYPVHYYDCVLGETSEYGLTEEKWVDENGNEVSFEDICTTGEKTRRTRAVLPARYNNAELGYVTSVKNQGQSGNCWAFAAMASAECSLLKRYPDLNKNSLDLSEAHHVWFAHKSLVNDSSDPTSGDGIDLNSPYKTGGTHTESIASLARGTGYVNESDYPFYPYDLDRMGNYSESARYESEYRLIGAYIYNHNDREQIKEAIMNNGALTVSFNFYNKYLTKTAGNYCFYCPGINTDDGIDGVISQFSQNHMATIVGWDDNYSVSNFTASTPPGDGAWICKNSWGSSWGNNGYFYLSYYDFFSIAIETNVVEKNDKNDTIYQYDGAETGRIVYADDSDSEKNKVSFANVFTAKSDENIYRVSFTQYSKDYDYTLKIYTSVDTSGSSPATNGTLALTQSGKISEYGYYTLELNKLVKVKKGEKFSVVLSVTTSESSSPSICVEGPTEEPGLIYNYTRYYNSSPNQSFYKIGSNGWVDSNKAGNNNVTIKAFTISAEPLEISNAEQLRSFAESVNSGTDYYGRTVTLTDDIDLSESYGIVPIGTQANPFKGYFNGNGKVIKNLCITKPSLDNVGLFGYTDEKSTVTSVGLENAYIKGKNNVGGLIGRSYSISIDNCYVTGNVKGTENVGGLIGYNASASTKNSFSNANVTGKSTYGSFAGYGVSSYRNCYTLDTLSPDGNADTVSGLFSKSSDDFKSGNVASSLKGVYFTYLTGFYNGIILYTDGYNNPEYLCDESKTFFGIGPVNGYYFTQGKDHPVYSSDQGDIIQSFDVKLVRNDVSEDEIVTLYVPRSKTPKSLIEEKYSDYTCKLYVDDDFSAEEFTDTISFEGKTFVAKLDRKPNSGNDPIIDEPIDEPAFYPFVDEIEDVDDFLLFAKSVNNSKSYEGITVTLKTDLDLAGVDVTPIGNDEHPFNGTFNGNGKVIRNLTISSPSSDNVGLFGITGTKCTIKNLGVENVNITGKENVGGLVGKSMSKEISNCYVAGSIKGNSNVGGLVGYNSSTTNKTCFSVATVTAPASYGSIAGYSESVYSNCYALDTIRPVAGADEISGIAGKSSEEFRNGNVAYLLTNPTGMYWTKGEDHPVLSANSKDKVHNLKIYFNKDDTGEWDRTIVYITETENLKSLLEELYDDYYCTVYNDAGFAQEFAGSVTTNGKILVAKLANKNSSGENPGNDDPGDDYPEIYQISTPEDLVELAKSVNNHSKSYYGKTVTLTADIDMTGIVFTPIGSGGTPFDGTFNGDGKVIRNLTVSSSDDNVGLFAMTGPSSVIKVLGLESVNIRGKDNVGGMVGFSMSKSIYNCHVEGNVTGENNVGGLVGKAFGNEVSNNYSVTKVTGVENVGGFIGCDESNTTTYSYTLSNVTAQTTYGSFVGYAGSSYNCCYTSGSTNTTGSNYQNSGISTKSIEDFKNGNVAFSLKSYATLYGVNIYVGFNGYHWAQGENYPVLSSDLNDCMHNLTLKVVKDDSPTTEQITIYLSGNDDPLKKVYDLYNGYNCTLYNDSDFTKDPFSGAITSDGKTLYAKLEKASITLVDDSPYRMHDDVIFGIEQGTTLSMLKEQLNQKDIVRCRDSYGSPVMQSSPIATGNLLFITNSQGRIIKDVKVSVSGDVTGDGYIDAFDLAVAGEYINTFTEPDDEAFMKACDMFEDGYLDATDLAYLMYIANFE